MRKVWRLVGARLSQRPLVLLTEQEYLLGAVIDARERRRMTLRCNDELGRNNLQAMRELGVRLAPVLASGYDPKPRRSELNFDVFQPVLGQERNAIIVAQPLSKKPLRQPVHAFVELTIGELLLPLLQGDGIREQTRLRAEPTTDCQR